MLTFSNQKQILNWSKLIFQLICLNKNHPQSKTYFFTLQMTFRQESWNVSLRKFNIGFSFKRVISTLPSLCISKSGIKIKIDLILF